MRINSVDTTTFGYNKNLDKRLSRKLIENEKDMECTIISQYRDFCNENEELLDLYYAGTSRAAEFVYALANAKHTLVDMVERKFPELNYRETEIKHYKRVADKIAKQGIDDNPWQYEVLDELDLMSYHDDFMSDEDSCAVRVIGGDTTVPYEQKLADLEAKKSEFAPSLTYEEKLMAIPDSDVVELFRPTFSSPQGFKSIAGMEDLKTDLYDKIIYPIQHPEEAKLDLAEYGKRQPRGVLFYGPPGCGKTYITEALSLEAELPMFKFKVSDAGSKYINETSENYKKVFDHVAESARAIGSPCILFMDEMDSISMNRNSDSSVEDAKQMGTLLNLIETARDRNIIVIGATNRFDMIDPAIKRRFDEQIYIPLPDEKLRGQVFEMTFKKWLKGQDIANDKEAIAELAQMTSGFPISALTILADKASSRARRDGRRPITKEDVIAEIATSQELKIDDGNYKTKSQRPKIGFHFEVGQNAHKS